MKECKIIYNQSYQTNQCLDVINMLVLQADCNWKAKYANSRRKTKKVLNLNVPYMFIVIAPGIYGTFQQFKQGKSNLPYLGNWNLRLHQVFPQDLKSN